MSLLDRNVLVAALAMASAACEKRGAPSDTTAVADTHLSTPTTTHDGLVDSAGAVQLLREAILARDPGQAPMKFRVVAFVADSTGYQITLFPDPVVPGGGGRALVTTRGEVRRLEMFR